MERKSPTQIEKVSDTQQKEEGKKGELREKTAGMKAFVKTHEGELKPLSRHRDQVEAMNLGNWSAIDRGLVLLPSGICLSSSSGLVWSGLLAWGSNWGLCGSGGRSRESASSPSSSHRSRAVNLTIQGHVFFGSVLGTSFEEVCHIDLHEFLDSLREKGTIRAHIRDNLFDAVILSRLSLCTRGLLNLEHQIASPERPAVKVILLVILEHLASIIGGALDLPQETSPLSNERSLCSHFALWGVQLGLVYFNGRLEATVAAAQISQRDNSLNMAREAHEDSTVDILGNICPA
jgi:hypothetical protein